MTSRGLSGPKWCASQPSTTRGPTCAAAPADCAAMIAEASPYWLA